HQSAIASGVHVASGHGRGQTSGVSLVKRSLTKNNLPSANLAHPYVVEFLANRPDIKCHIWNGRRNVEHHHLDEGTGNAIEPRSTEPTQRLFQITQYILVQTTTRQKRVCGCDNVRLVDSAGIVPGDLQTGVVAHDVLQIDDRRAMGKGYLRVLRR